MAHCCCLLLLLQFIHPLFTLPAHLDFHSCPPLCSLLPTHLLLPFFTLNLRASPHHLLTSNASIFCNSMFWPLPSCMCTQPHYVTLTYRKTWLIQRSVVSYLHSSGWVERDDLFTLVPALWKGLALEQWLVPYSVAYISTIQEGRNRFYWSRDSSGQVKGLAVGTVSQRRTLYAKYHIACGKNVSQMSLNLQKSHVDTLCTTPIWIFIFKGFCFYIVP